MELLLTRTYFKGGTNGKLMVDDSLLCETIELPWRNNKRSVSCIPEGRYRLMRRVHPKHGKQLTVANVPGREAILIHPANFAIRELQGCIAPVTKCTGEGEGSYSRVALERLETLVDPVLSAGEVVTLVIVSASVLGK